MPVDLQIIRASEFVRVDASGRFDLESTKGVLIALAHACHKRSVFHALIDVRGGTSDLTPGDLAALASAFSKTTVSKRLRLALLHNGNQNYRAKLFAFIGTMRGEKIRAFEDFEEALDWLSTSESKPARTCRDPENEVPIRRVKSLPRRIVVSDGRSNP
jgi:hypothetical protein